MACLITGGTGFIGALVAKKLVAQGETVIAYDLAASRSYLELVLTPHELEQVTIVHGDVLDLPLLIRSARYYHIDKIVHLAYMLARTTEQNPAHGCRVNVEGTNNVFETATIVGAPRVVWASSITVFGPKSVGSNGIVANDAAFAPVTIYGATKIVNEMTARRYARSQGLEPIGLRLPVVYGPEAKQGWAAFLSKLIENLAKGLPGTAPQSEGLIPWIYIEDVAQAVFLAIHAQKSDTLVFNLLRRLSLGTRSVLLQERAFLLGSGYIP